MELRGFRGFGGQRRWGSLGLEMVSGPHDDGSTRSTLNQEIGAQSLATPGPSAAISVRRFRA